MDCNARFRQIDSEVSREARAAAERQQEVSRRLAEEMDAAKAALRDAVSALRGQHIPKADYYVQHHARPVDDREFRYSAGVARRGWVYNGWVLTEDSHFFSAEPICTQRPKLFQDIRAQWFVNSSCVCESAAIADHNPIPFVEGPLSVRKPRDSRPQGMPDR